MSLNFLVSYYLSCGSFSGMMQDDFLDKYESLEALLAKCYPNEGLNPSSAEMKEIFKNFQS